MKLTFNGRNLTMNYITIKLNIAGKIYYYVVPEDLKDYVIDLHTGDIIYKNKKEAK